MAQVKIASLPGATYVGEEVTYATLPTMLRAFVVQNSWPKYMQTPIKNDDERVRLGSHIAPSRGLKTWSDSLQCYVKPGTQLVAAASPADHYLATLMRCAWGGHDATAGSTVASGTTSSVVVGAGHGTRFKIGGWIGVETGVAGGTIEPARVTNISTDTLTIYPNLSASPFATGRVVNGETFYWTDTNTKTLALQKAKAQANTTARFTGLGARVGFSLAINRDGMITATFSLNGSSWSMPGSDAVSVADATDAIGSCFVGKSLTTLFQPAATTTRVHYPMQSVEPSWIGDMGLAHIPEMGGTEGTLGTMRVAGRPIATFKNSQIFDSDSSTGNQALYEAGTEYGLICIVPQGSGTSQRFLVIDFPRLVYTQVPETADANGHHGTVNQWEAMEDNTTTTSGLTGTNLDRAVSAARVIII